MKPQLAWRWEVFKQTLEQLLEDEHLDLLSDFSPVNSPDQAVANNDTQPTDSISYGVQDQLGGETYETQGGFSILGPGARFHERGASASTILTQDQNEI